MTLLWPLQSGLDAWREAGRIPPGHCGGRGRVARARAAWAAALRHNAPPLEFFAYRMADGAGPAAEDWLFSPEMVWLLRRLNAPEALRTAHDKRAFADFCRESGLAHVPVLGCAEAGAGALPEPDLPGVVIKPRSGSNARGVSVWLRAGDGWARAGEEGPGRPWPAPVAAARADGAGEVVLQPLLAPHPALRRWPGPGAAAARIVTGAWPDGAVEVLHASFAVPRAGAASSNGGARRRVDPGSGACLPLGPGRLRPVWSDTAPPDMRDLPEGFVLPDWAAALALVQAAHRAFPAPAVLLGWDVAFTPDGPVLIETNVAISFFLEQMESLEPAGGGRAAALIASWLP